MDKRDGKRPRMSSLRVWTGSLYGVVKVRQRNGVKTSLVQT